MRNLKDRNQITEQLNKKEDLLDRILCSDFPIRPELADGHRRRQINSKLFLSELREIRELIDVPVDLVLVTHSTFTKQIEKADFSSMEYDGIYCKLASIQNFPYDDIYLLYVASVNSI